MRNRTVSLLIPVLWCAAVIATPPARAAEADPAVLFDMDTVRHTVGQITDKDKKKVPAGTAESIDGKFGKAVKFSFVEGASGGFMTGRVNGQPAWDQADGFSFWVKGDGSNSFGGLELIDKSDFGVRYGYCFPIDSTDWRKITVRWTDMTPELAGPLMDPKGGGGGGYAPSALGNFWFGKWYYWRDYPAHSYAIDQVALEPKIEAPAAVKFGPGLDRFRAKLKAKQPVTVVTMGDSLSDQRHWSNRQVVWSQLLAKAIETKHESKVTIVNPAIGGTTLSQNVILIPRWAREAPKPDLVTIWFGGNDWDTKVRGERFAQYLRLAVDRVRAATDGQADVLILTTAPAHARWETYKELEDAARAVAKEKQAGLADAAAEFRKAAGTPDEGLKQNFWVWDKVHLGQRGHEVARDAVLHAIENP